MTIKDFKIGDSACMLVMPSNGSVARAEVTDVTICSKKRDKIRVSYGVNDSKWFHVPEDSNDNHFLEYRPFGYGSRLFSTRTEAEQFIEAARLDSYVKSHMGIEDKYSLEQLRAIRAIIDKPEAFHKALVDAREVINSESTDNLFQVINTLVDLLS